MGPETVPECQFLGPETMLTHFNDFWAQKLTHFVSFWAHKSLKWVSIMDQFLGSETDTLSQFLGQEIVKMGKGSRQNKKTVKLGNVSQPPMTPPPPSKLGKNM